MLSTVATLTSYLCFLLAVNYVLQSMVALYTHSSPIILILFQKCVTTITWVDVEFYCALVFFCYKYYMYAGFYNVFELYAKHTCTL